MTWKPSRKSCFYVKYIVIGEDNEKENLLDIAEKVFVSGSTLAINMLLPIIGPIINEVADLPS
jgi:hypothetical protein